VTRLRSASRWLALASLVAIGGSVVGLVLLVGLVAALNSEFRAAQASSITLGGPTAARPFAATLSILSLDEGTNTAVLQLRIVAQPSPTLDSILTNKLSVTFELQPGLGDLSLDPQITLHFDTSTNRTVNQDSPFVEASFAAQTVRSISPFPFDDHMLFFVIWNWGTDGLTRPFTLTVAKRPAFRVLSLGGEPTVPQITLSRPTAQKGFILFASIVFVLMSAILAYRLNADSHEFGRLPELLGIAGLVIGITGFRELIGVTKASHFTLLETIVVGGPLAALATGFLRAAWRRQHSPGA